MSSPLKALLMLWLLACSLQGALAQPASAARVALVVGISEYQHAPRLSNPANDAREVALRLRRFGFDVEQLAGPAVHKRDLDDALVRLRQRATRAEAVLVFFAGHGIEIDGRNYLLPGDAKLHDERDVRREAVALEDVLAELRSERTDRVNLVILDACRENPFRNRLAGAGRTVSRGLTRPDARLRDTLIAFATAAGDIAADNPSGPNSPYTAALLEVMDREPQLEVGLFFRRVRAKVMQAAPQQQPWEHGSLLGEFYFVRPQERDSRADGSGSEGGAWALCRAASTRAPCEAYLVLWPQGQFAEQVRGRLGQFGATAGAGSSPMASQVATRPDAAPACQPTDYVVKPGDTMVRIGLEHGVNWRDILKANGMESPNLLEVGQLLRLPCPPPRSAEPTEPPAAPPGQSAEAETLAWVWPTLAPVLRPSSPDFIALEFAGPRGSDVFAAADGRVVYAGTGLRGYGVLVLVKHSPTYLTAYVHLDKAHVKEDQVVRRGQVIGLMGDTDADRVKLRFEIRKFGKPVDPMGLLPPR